MYEYTNGKMKPSYAPSNFELLHPWSGRFYMETTGYCDDGENENINLAWAEMTEKALKENMPKSGIIEWNNGKFVYCSDMPNYTDLWEYFDYAINKATCEVVKSITGNIVIYNECGWQVKFIPDKNVNPLDIVVLAGNEIGDWDTFEEYVDAVKELGIQDVDLFAECVKDYFRC